MKYFLMLVAAVLLACNVASAGEKPKGGNDAPVPYYHDGTRAVETEPNDDCSQASGPLTVGSFFDGEITAGDYDWYEFTAAGGECVIFETHAQGAEPTVDTYMYLYADDCTTELATDDDGGAGAYSKIRYDFTAAGTYYVVVRGYGSTSAGFYTLTADACPEPPPNVDCSTAIDLQVLGLDQFTVDTCEGGNTYNSTNLCTGYSQTNGQDIVYKIYLTTGETFSVALTDEDYDASLWLMAEGCDPTACLAGGDDPEEFSYQATADGWYYLIVDGYCCDYCGTATVVITGPIGTQQSSWGSLKSLYR